VRAPLLPMPLPLPSPAHPTWLAAVLAAALLHVGLAQAQAPAPNDHLTQQLREAIERSNAQRAGTGHRRMSSEVPSITVNVGGAEGTHVSPAPSAAPTLPTPPTAPRPPPAASAPLPARVPSAAAAAPAEPASAAPPALAVPATAPKAARIALPERPGPAASAASAAASAAAAPAPAAAPPASVKPALARPAERYSNEQIRRQYERARAIANGFPIPASARLPRDGPAPEAKAPAAPPRPPVPWSYTGEGGPAAWGQLQPEYQLCGNGQRQSPIHIEASATLQGPNEALVFDYQAGGGAVLHDGRTIRVEVEGNHLLQVRGATYRLEYLDFHHPGEAVINHQAFAMSAHLVHRDAQGRKAIVAVLLQPGEASAFIDKVWTYIPLDVGDSVRMPPGWLDASTLLPQDQRYYQYFGSMSTPPCEEGVLWMVLKQPVTLSAAQLQLFARLFPHNARPVQALNGRIVRDAQ
jgi:carbonic anhydrase